MKKTWKALTLGGLAAVGAGLSLAAGYQLILSEANRLELEQVKLPLPRLGPAFAGFRIAQLTDFHLFPFTQPEFIQQAVDIVNGLRPDLVVLTGDYVSHEAHTISHLAPILARLQARHGVMAVLGNHDYHDDASVVKKGLEDAGISVLLNRGIMLEQDGQHLYIAGLDDARYGNPDPQLALADCPTDIPAIVLLHEPDMAEHIATDPRVVLQISGHTHGGQIIVPFIGPPILPKMGRRYLRGLFEVDGMWLYVSRGLGASGVPVRFQAAPEITEFTLEPQTTPDPGHLADGEFAKVVFGPLLPLVL